MNQRTKIQSIQNSLLSKFISEKSRAYIEPQREGTPKGETIGFSMRKYLATLYMLRTFKQKDISDLIGVSHGLLRVWRTEETFKKTITGNCIEFSEYVVSFLLAKINKGWIESNFPSQLEDLQGAFIDSKFYSPLLVTILFTMLTKAVEELNDLVFTSEVDLVISIFRHLGALPKQSKAQKAEDEKTVKECKHRVEAELLSRVKGILLK